MSNPIKIGIATATPTDITAALHLLAVLNDLDEQNHPLRAGRSFIRDEHGDWRDDDPAAFNPKDPSHTLILTDRLLKILNQSPGFLIRVIGGFTSLIHADNRLVDADSATLAPHPEITAAREKAGHYDTLRTALEVITHVVGHNDCSDGRTPNGFVVALEKARSALELTKLAN